MKKREKIQLGAILMAGLLFRLLSTWQKDFWFDEAFSWALAKQEISQILAATAADNNPPLYYLVLHFWLKLGSNELFLRLPSIFFGTIALFFLYQVAKKLFNQKVALTSCLIFAFSPLHVYFSAEARMYSLWTMLTLAGFYYFLKILRSPQKISYLHFGEIHLFNILFLISFYTHYFTLFFLLALGLFLILKIKKYQKQLISLLLSQVVIAFLFLPWAFYFLINPHPRPWHISPLIGIPATFASFVLGGVGSVTLKTFFAPTVPFLIKGVFTLTFVFFLSLFLLGIRGKEKNEEKNLLLLLVFLPILTVTLISLFYPIYSPRQFLVFAPYFYILVSLGIEKLGRGWIKILAVTSLVFILFVQNFYPPFKPQTLKKAADFIKKHSPTPIIVHTDILTFYPFTYYFKEKASQFLVFPSELTRRTTDIIGGSPVSLSKITEKDKSFFSVHFIWDEKTTKFKEEQTKLNENFDYKLVKQFNHLEIFYYQNKVPSL